MSSGGTHWNSWKIVLAIAPAVALIGAACGGGADDSSVATTVATSSTASDPPTTPAPVTTTTPAVATSVTPTTAQATTTVAPTTTAAPAQLGDTWERVAGFGEIGAADVFLGSAGARTLAVAFDPDRRTATSVRIFELTQADGWTEVADLVTMGLPVGQDISYPGDLPGQLAIGGDDSVAVVALATPPAPGVSADGASGDLWLATDDGSGWQLAGPADTGIDQRLEGPSAFRFTDIAGVSAADGVVHVALQAQWWEPFSTGGAELAVVARDASGAWTTFAAQENDSGAGTMFPASVASQPDGNAVVVGTGAMGDQRGLRAWYGAGSTWQPVPLLATEDADTRIDVVGVAHGDAGWIVVANVDSQGTERIVAWQSTDGTTWQSHDVVGPEQGAPAEQLLGACGRYLLFDQDAALWVSQDGVEWALVPPPAERSLPNGTVTLLDSAVAVVSEIRGFASPVAS